jgi:hypothetical protein
VEELEEEDQFTATIVMRKGIWREISHFQEDPGLHTIGVTPMLLNNLWT